MMISALFNILCVGTFATFGLTCSIIHKLCAKKYGRKYPAIEYVPCPYKKNFSSPDSAPICKRTSILKKTNQRKIMAGGESSCANYESDEENFSEASSICSKRQKSNITICGTNSCRPNNLNVKIVPCPNACRGLCKVGQSTPSEKSYSYNNEGSNQAISFCTSKSESVCSINLETRETSKSSLDRSTSKCDTSTSALINLIRPTSDQQKSDCSADISICQTDVKSDASEDITTFLEVCKLNAFPCCGCHSSNSVSSRRNSSTISQNENLTQCSKDCPKQCCQTCNCVQSIENFQTSTRINDNKIKSGSSDSEISYQASNKLNIQCSKECQKDCCSVCTCTQTNTFETSETSSQTLNINICSKECQKDCCSQCNCTQTIVSTSETSSQTSNKINDRLCSNECQTDCCTECKCSQTESRSNFRNNNKCSQECNNDCCLDCNCAETSQFGNKTASHNSTSQIKCSQDCQTDCCTECKCSQTTAPDFHETFIQTCNRECQKDCCTMCKCAQTDPIDIRTRGTKEYCTKCNCPLADPNFETSDLRNKRKSNICSEECQKDCCIKCKCNIKNRRKPKVCTKECQMDCCTDCKCAQTDPVNIRTRCTKDCRKDCCTYCKCSQTSPDLQSRRKTTSCSERCQTDCCKECKCAQTLNPSTWETSVQTKNRTKNSWEMKCNKKCQKDCCTKCKCAQTTNQQEFDSRKSTTLSSHIIKPILCRTGCLKDCCADCKCGDSNKNALESQLDVLSNFPESDYPKSEFSVNTAKSSMTMMLKRKSTKRKCCSPLCLINNDEVLIEGDIQLKEMSNGSLKYVFETEESDHTVRVHELILKVKKRGSQDNENFSVEEILDNYLLKLKVHS